MRASFVLSLLLLPMLLPVAAAAAADPPLVIDPDVELSPDGCEDCIHASLTVAQTYPDNCADCGGIGVYVAADHDGDDTVLTTQVCRGGFVVICVVDREIPLPL